MKTILVFFLAFFYSYAFSQDYMHGYFGSKYNAVSDKGDKIVNKSIHIIFNHTFCKLYIQDKGSEYFDTYNYQTSIEKDGIHIFFQNMETHSLSQGWYGIEVVENKNGVNFHVTLPNFSYYVENASMYSEDGKITKYVSVDYDKQMAWKHEQDSLIIAKEKQRVEIRLQEHLEDSLYTITRDSTLYAANERKLNEGDNFNKTDIKWIADLVSKKVNIDAYCYGDVRIIIDKDGNVTDAKSANIFQGVQYIDLIKNSIVGQKTKPFISDNGKAYPSFAMVYIYLEPAKKEKKSSVFNKVVNKIY